MGPAGRGALLSTQRSQDARATLTIDRYRDDTIELIELLRKNYGKRKVFLLGHSWVQ
jgi:alpha-beta hydrolase superfamily lysophospholipase